MNNITHARVDYRLIHGQVITKWLRVSDASQILIIDDNLSKDEFMKKIFVMAAPNNIQVDIISTEESVAYFENIEKKTLLLFKDINTIVDTVEKGLVLDSLQIGGLENNSTRKIVHNQISLSKEEYLKLRSLEGKGINIYFQTIPEEKPSDLNDVQRKLRL